MTSIKTQVVISIPLSLALLGREQSFEYSPIRCKKYSVTRPRTGGFEEVDVG